MAYQLKERQKEAARAIDKDLFENGCNKVLASIATGWGKTILASALFKKYTRLNNRRCLFIANRSELINQTIEKFKDAFGLDADLEKAESRASLDSSVVVASCQTLSMQERLERFPDNHFDFIVVDESHGILSDQYQKILNHFDSKWLFLTATADKLCDKDLFSIIDKVSYEYTLKQSIEEGYNCKPVVKKLNLNLMGINLDDEKILDSVIKSIATEAIETLRAKKTIIFLPSVERSHKTAEMLKELGLNAIHCDGYMPDSERQEALKKVNEGGPGTVICNATLLATGYDQPDLDCIIVLRNVSIRDLYCQMIGRVLRLSPGKRCGIIIDVLGQLNTFNIFASISELEKSRNIVFDYSGFEAGERDLMELDAERNNLLEESLALKIIKQNEQAQYKNLVSYDLFCKLFKHEHIEGKTIINEQQIQRIHNSGVSVIGVNNFENASKIIEILNNRSAEKLATPKQVRLISRQVVHPLLLTFEKATEIITSMKKNNRI